MTHRQHDEFGHEVCVAQREKGYCGVWLDGETTCAWPHGSHDPHIFSTFGEPGGPSYREYHRGYAPSGDGRWIDFDRATLREVARGGGWDAGNDQPKSREAAPARRTVAEIEANAEALADYFEHSFTPDISIDLRPLSKECRTAYMTSGPALHDYCLRTRMHRGQLLVGREYPIDGLDCGCPCHAKHPSCPIPQGARTVVMTEDKRVRMTLSTTPGEADRQRVRENIAELHAELAEHERRELSQLRAIVVDQARALGLLRARVRELEKAASES